MRAATTTTGRKSLATEPRLPAPDPATAAGKAPVARCGPWTSPRPPSGRNPRCRLLATGPRERVRSRRPPTQQEHPAGDGAGCAALRLAARACSLVSAGCGSGAGLASGGAGQAPARGSPQPQARTHCGPYPASPPCPELGKTWSCHLGDSKAEVLCPPPAGAKTRESFRLCLETFLDSKTVPIIKVLRARLWSQIAVQRSRPEVRGWGVSEKSHSLAADVGRKHTLKTDLGGKPEEEV